MINIFQTQLEGQVVGVIKDSIEKMGFDLVRVKVFGGGKNKTLQIMADRQDGSSITIDDCEKISRMISVLLDVEDIVDDRYNLEVSSPGVYRPLTKFSDFAKFVGKPIKLTTLFPINNQRRFSGMLVVVEGESIVIKSKVDNENHKIEFNNLDEASLEFVEEQKDNQKDKKKSNNKKSNDKKNKSKGER
jgi:ribosome maturation factor RimP